MKQSLAEPAAARCSGVSAVALSSPGLAAGRATGAEAGRRGAVALGWLAAGAAFVASRAGTLADPPYWDARYYLSVARFAAAHRLDLSAWQGLYVAKPPLAIALFALVGSASGWSMRALHATVLVFAAAGLPAVYLWVRALGGTRRAAWIGLALLATAPIWAAQAGLTLSDLPLAVLAAWAFVALLGRRPLVYALLAAAAVLTKECAWWLAIPALYYCWRRRLGWRREEALPRLALAATPAIVLALWLLLLHHVYGTIIQAGNRGAISIHSLQPAALHTFVDGGRLPLALLSAWLISRERRGPLRHELFATALFAIALPLTFPTLLPRYMLATLPALCALAARATDLLPPVGRAIAVAALVAGAALGWRAHGPSDWQAWELEAAPAYRDLLATQIEAGRAVAAEHPRAVLATFPMQGVLSADPWEGWLPAPVTCDDAFAPLDDATLCRHDLLVDAAQSLSIAPVRDRLRALGALTPWRSFGEPGREVWVSRISCPTPPPLK